MRARRRTTAPAAALLALAVAAMASLLFLPHAALALGRDVVIELTDATFEHDTQAATGHTTGDWFVSFTAADCARCGAAAALWPELAAELAGLVNVAHVDASTSPQVAERFGLAEFPALLYLHRGELFRYRGKLELADLLAFAQGLHEEDAAPDGTRGEPVPPEPTADVAAAAMEALQALPVPAVAAAAAAVALALLAYLARPTSRATTKTD